MPKSKDRITKPLTLTPAQMESVEKAMRVAGVKSLNQFVLMALSRTLDDFPLDLPGRGEMNQPEDVIMLVRVTGTALSIERTDKRPEKFFRRLYRADLRAAGYCVGAGWTNSLFNARLIAIEHDLALEAMEA